MVMDNLLNRKRLALQERIGTPGACLVFLPSYNPDFNTIKKAFACLKVMLHKAAERPASGLCSLIGRLVDLFQPAECANYFSSCG